MSENGKKNQLYLVTRDLEALIGNWCEENHLTSPEIGFFKKLSDQLLNSLRNTCFVKSNEGDESIIVRYWDHNMFEHLDPKNDPEREKSFWITLDELVTPDADSIIPVTRLYDLGLKKTSARGARPKENGIIKHEDDKKEKLETLETLILNCATKYHDHGKPDRVILSDDGTYEGNTMVIVMRELQKFGINVSEIRIGYCRVESFEILEKFDAERFVNDNECCPLIYRPGLVLSGRFLLDWVCERDFYIGVPRSGLTLAEKINDEYVPCLPVIAPPYLWHWGEIKRDASIDKGEREFSLGQIDDSITLWEEIQRMNKDQFKLSPLLVKQLPRFPGKSKDAYEKYKDWPVIDYIKEQKNRY
jgi:hypothetical protein